MSYVGKCADFYQQLKDAKLAPIDLYNWDTLTLLESLTRNSRRIGEKRENLKEFRALRSQIFAALERKAKDYERSHHDSTYKEWLDELKEEIRSNR